MITVEGWRQVASFVVVLSGVDRCRERWRMWDMLSRRDD